MGPLCLIPCQTHVRFMSCSPSESFLSLKILHTIDISSVPSQNKALYSALWETTKISQTHLAKRGLEPVRDLVMSINIYKRMQLGPKGTNRVLLEATEGRYLRGHPWEPGRKNNPITLVVHWMEAPRWGNINPVYPELAGCLGTTSWRPSRHPRCCFLFQVQPPILLLSVSAHVRTLIPPFLIYRAGPSGVYLHPASISISDSWAPSRNLAGDGFRSDLAPDFVLRVSLTKCFSL